MVSKELLVPDTNRVHLPVCGVQSRICFVMPDVGASGVLDDVLLDLACQLRSSALVRIQVNGIPAVDVVGCVLQRRGDGVQDGLDFVKKKPS